MPQMAAANKVVERSSIIELRETNRNFHNFSNSFESKTFTSFYEIYFEFFRILFLIIGIVLTF